MKIIVATDSYKGTINAPDATAIIADALAEKLPLAQILRMPFADGGSARTSTNSRRRSELPTRDIAGVFGGEV